MNTGTSRASALRKSTVIGSTSGSGVHSGSPDSTSVTPSWPPSTDLDLLRRRIDDRLLGLRALRIDHRLADHAEPHALQRARRRRRLGVAGIGRAQHRGARHRGERIARIVIALLRVLQRVENFRAVADLARMDAGAVAIDVGADRAAVEADHRLVRQDQRDGVVVGRAAARRPRLLAEARHHEVGADRHARARARAERSRARGVIRDSTDCRPRCCADSRASTAAPCPACCGRRDRRRGRCIRCSPPWRR